MILPFFINLIALFFLNDYLVVFLTLGFGYGCCMSAKKGVRFVLNYIKSIEKVSIHKKNFFVCKPYRENMKLVT